MIGVMPALLVPPPPSLTAQLMGIPQGSCGEGQLREASWGSWEAHLPCCPHQMMGNHRQSLLPRPRCSSGLSGGENGSVLSSGGGIKG